MFRITELQAENTPSKIYSNCDRTYLLQMFRANSDHTSEVFLISAGFYMVVTSLWLDKSC